MKNKRTQILETAGNLCNGDREQQYGDPQENFETVAQMWSAYLGTKVAARDVCNLMALIKIARLKNGPHWDSAVDGAAYLALGEEVSDA